MRFYIEYKWPSMYDVFRDNLSHNYSDGFIPWTDQLKTMVEVNRLYQAWLKENPTQEDVDLGNVPENIKELLNSITRLNINLKWNFSEEHMALFPGLEYDDYFSYDTSIDRISCDKTLDLEKILANSKGISIDIIEKLVPQCKFMATIIELTIRLTEAQFEQRNKNNDWTYIRWETFFEIAGIPLYTYMPNGTSLFQPDKNA